MGRIFCIFGKSGSGKDTVYKALIRDRELALRGVVTYTTRPKREYETDGVEYHFIDEKALRRLQAEGRVIELRRYDTVKGVWYYCTVDDGSFELERGDYLTIATLDAFISLGRYFGNGTVVPIYLEVEDGLRLMRLIERERRQPSPDYAEICRRFLADCRDFSPERLKSAGVTAAYDNAELGDCLRRIRAMILSFKQHSG